MGDLVPNNSDTTKSTSELRESSATLTAIAGSSGKKFKARLIEGERWGSSGYYSKKVLERDGPTTWPAGTQIYLDHPSATENYDRPERSVRDLAGKILTTPVYEGDGLYSEVEFYPHYAPIIESMWQDVGMSIRASATIQNGEVGGRTGPIIQSLEGGLSVDVVTQAGAGGKLISLLESAREGAPRTIKEATANDTREWLQAAIKDAHAQDTGWVWLRDYDDANVWYESESEGDAGTFQQGYTLTGSTVTLTGEPVAVRVETRYVPLETPAAEAAKDSAPNPAAVTEKKETAVMATTNIEESELKQLRESASRATAAEAEITTVTNRATAAEAGLTEANDTAAAAVVEAAFAAAGISAPKTAARLSKGYPVKENGVLNSEALASDVAESIAELQVANGAGRVHGAGTTSPVNESGEPADSDVLTALKGA